MIQKSSGLQRPAPPAEAGRQNIVRQLASSLQEERGALLPILHAVQKALGHVHDDDIPVIAATLNLSRAEVHGVVSFYHDFRRRRAGRHVVKLCRAESCQARGATAVERQLEQRLGVVMNETRTDERVTLEAVYCLGLCAIGPNALVDGVPHARLDGTKISALADGLDL